MATEIPDPAITVRAEVMDDYAIEFVIKGNLDRRTSAIDDAVRALRDACTEAVAERTGRPDEVIASAVYASVSVSTASVEL
ncbi:hypothetical protein ACFCZT_07720 [Streptomyces sp. NPDC056230]|uniref:hypothetical protein n=1 Tax=Streptomyces sp. NPDC056230 TaxID=3345754 RepID=UPI0035E13EC1